MSRSPDISRGGDVVQGRVVRFPPALLVFAGMMVVLALASAVYTLVCAKLLHRPYPYGLPVFGGLPTFSDFTDFASRYAHFGTREFWHHLDPSRSAQWQKEYPLIYPAPLLAVIAFFFKLPHPLVSYFLVYLVFLTVAAGVLMLGLMQRQCTAPASAAFALLLIVTSFPLFFVASRGNLEGINALLLSLGLYLLVERRSLYGGAIAIGLAASMKYYPILPLAYLLSIRAYKPFLAGLCTAAAATMIAIVYIDPTLTEYVANLQAASTFMSTLYTGALQWPEFDHSAFMLFKLLVKIVFHSHDPSYVADFSTNPYLIVVAVAGLVLYFARLRRMPVLNQIIGLTVCSVLMPPISYDYALANLLMPCILLCFYAADIWRRRRPAQGLFSAFGCFALIFTWGTFFNVAHQRFSGEVRAVALLALLGIVLAYPFDEAAGAVPASRASILRLRLPRLVSRASRTIGRT